MNRTRRILVATLALVPLAAPLAVRAQQRRAGADFTLLKPEQPVEAPGKVEVIEFFWYGCPHCYDLEPVLEPWIRKLSADVQFRRVPAVFNERWARDAAVFYALEAMGVGERLHRPLFDAIHRDRLRTDNDDALNQWLQRQGVDPKKFGETLRSFGVQSSVRRAHQQSIAYRIDGTPAMAVQGRYTISAEQARSHQGMLDTADYLIGEARKTLAKK